MAGFYEGMRDNVAGSLIDKFGQVISVSRGEETSYDPIDGTATQETSPFSPTVLVTNYNKRDIDGSLIKQGDLLVFVKAESNGWEPKQGDKLTIDGDERIVINVSPVSPAGIVVLYEVQVRK